MEQDNQPPHRNENTHDDNRDNRMPEARQVDNRDAAAGKKKAQNQEKSRGPDMRAFTVVDRGKDQKPFWREIGSANRHDDGLGLTVHTDATPHDGKIVLREQRREEFKEKRTMGREGQSRSRERKQERGQSREQ